MIDIKTTTRKQVFQKILVNGEEVMSFDDLPEDIKQKLDKNGDKQIDVLQQLGNNEWDQQLVSSSLEVNGKKVAIWEHVPKGLQPLKQLTDQLQANDNEQSVEMQFEPLESTNLENKPIQVSHSLESLWTKLIVAFIILGVLFFLFAKDLHGWK